ncbi:hypothetical protein [Rhodohalobacter halophilus]|uniref:hypothetical protein n=1 Tax=Rhodohalobacter halophilus TaxID=1812810 RepID=UPI0015B3B4BC|nr:hypothetical protein [Rhodohalobacter halophilus]
MALLMLAAAGTPQYSDVDLSVSMSETFSQNDLDDLLIGMTEQSFSTALFNITVENTSSGILRDNFIKLELKSEEFGTILMVEQTASGLFTLNPNGRITFSNLDVSDVSNLSIEGEPSFDFTLTSNGRRLVQNIRRGYLITDDRYTLDISLMQRMNDEFSKISGSSVSFETTLNRSELTIQSEPEVISGLRGLNVSEEAPQFQWNGEPNQVYRLIIVDADRAMNSDRLFDERFNLDHSEESIRDESLGVVLDVLADSPQYQIPERFAGLFEPGKTYRWQVQTTKQTVRNEEVQVFSERFEFTTCFPIEGEMRTLLVNLFGEERTEEFIENGLLFDQIQIDGVSYSKDEALRILREMAGKIERNQLKVVS